MRSDEYEETEERTESLIGRLALRLILFSAGFLLLFIAATRAYSFGKEIFYQKPMEKDPGTDVVIEIPQDCDGQALAQLLMEKGAIANERAVVVQVKLYKIEPEPGSYTVNTSMTPKEILMSISEQSEEIRESVKQVQDEDILGGGDEAGDDNGN